MSETTPKLDVPNPMTREFADALARAALVSHHSYTPSVRALNIQRRELWQGAWALYCNALEHRLLDGIEAALKELSGEANAVRRRDAGDIVVTLSSAPGLHEVFAPHVHAGMRNTSSWSSVPSVIATLRPTGRRFNLFEKVAVRVEPIDVMLGNIEPVAQKLAKWHKPVAEALGQRILSNKVQQAEALATDAFKRALLPLIDAKGCPELKAVKKAGEISVTSEWVAVTVQHITVKLFATARWPLHPEPTVARFNAILPKLTELTEAASLADASIRSH